MYIIHAPYFDASVHHSPQNEYDGVEDCVRRLLIPMLKTVPLDDINYQGESSFIVFAANGFAHVSANVAGVSCGFEVKGKPGSGDALFEELLEVLKENDQSDDSRFMRELRAAEIALRKKRQHRKRSYNKSGIFTGYLPGPQEEEFQAALIQCTTLMSSERYRVIKSKADDAAAILFQHIYSKSDV